MGKMKNKMIDIMNAENKMWYEDTIYEADNKQYKALQPIYKVVNIGTEILPVLVYKRIGE